MTVRNVDTDRVYVIQTNRDGRLHLVVPEGGRFVVVRYSYRFRSPGGFWVERSYVPREAHQFALHCGFVTNAGRITWYEDRGRMRDWEER